MTVQKKAGGPAGLVFMTNLMRDGEVASAHRARAIAALSQKNKGLASAIRQFSSENSDQQKVVDMLADAAERFERARPDKVTVVWDKALAWLVDGGTISWEEIEGPWDVRFDERGRRLTVTVSRPDAEKCPEIEVDWADLLE